MKKLSWLVLILVCFSVFSVKGQSGNVLSPDEVTEAGLIEMLAPERSIRTRSIKVFRSEPESLPDGPASASMMITFKTNSAVLTDDAIYALDKVGRALNMDKLADLKFVIEGHTDPRGSFILNQNLSQARAEAVKDYLVWKHNVNRERLVAVGKGYSELINRDNPIAPENRRVTIVRADER
ncbi:MAG: OmpA family protein [Burkholderiales bacterium]|nr:OmpA family protein [Nitrosomonas sp.]MCP5273356.1 OmpA family protein [Burkholderiales bacterium]